jgi:anti-sigma B factor antagonist
MISIEKKENINIVTFPVNNINALITDEIRDSILKVIDDSNPKVIIDLTGVEYIDSSGFGCFLSLMRAVKSNYGILKFTNPEPAIMKMFITLHLNTVFEIYDDIDKCIMSFR